MRLFKVSNENFSPRPLPRPTPSTPPKIGTLHFMEQSYAPDSSRYMLAGLVTVNVQSVRRLC